MHEIGALHQLVVEAEAIAKANGVRRIKEINIELGELSGMLPEFFEKYYSIVIENREILKDSELKIHMIPGEGLCRNCNTLYNVSHNQGVCPRCTSRNKKILSGMDLVLKNIVIDEENIDA